MSITRHQAVGAYQRWQPEPFDESDQTASPSGKRRALPEPEPDPELDPDVSTDTEPDETHSHTSFSTPEFKLPTAEEIEAMYEQARSEGHATGLEEGRATGRAEGLTQGKIEAKKEADRLAGLVNTMNTELDRLHGEIAEEIVTLALVVARQMVGQTLAAHPIAIADTVREALQQLPQGKARVHVHPDDVALLREYLDDQLEHGHHHILEDASMTPGGCIVEAAGCQIDGSIETRWQRVLNGIGRQSPEWQAYDGAAIAGNVDPEPEAHAASDESVATGPGVDESDVTDSGAIDPDPNAVPPEPAPESAPESAQKPTNPLPNDMPDTPPSPNGKDAA